MERMRTRTGRASTDLPTLRPRGARLIAASAIAVALLSASFPAVSATASRRARLPRPIVHLSARDPGFPSGYQVGDTLTVTARITRGRIRPGGKVTFTTDERYDRGCKAARLGHDASVVCYITFYVPGRHRITARFVALDRSVATRTISILLSAPTNA